ncbi:MAG TPA: tetratricopeptide repeat protein, partial [Saprospiraceae bacterium]|nr:tetratricopeptide repeat protein [Saprospiraceae bacterium]
MNTPTKALLLVCCVGWLYLLPLSAQPSVPTVQKQGDTAFGQADYRTALQYYRQAGTEHASDKAARLRMGISLFEINDVDGALKIFQSIIQEGKTDAIVFFYAARCCEAKYLFQEAIGFYKRFLQRSKPDNPQRIWVKDQLLRCANGLRMKYADETAYVENAGTTINSVQDEYGVKNSPTLLGKIYFNSNRENISSAKFSTQNVDIYSSLLENGRWSAPVPLPAHINSAGYEEVCGFSADGQILYYLTQSSN